MPRGFPHHLDLTVTDLPRSIAFYDKVLGELGYARTGAYAGDVPCWVLHMDVPMSRAQDAQERLSGEGTNIFSIGLHAARNDVAHDRYSAGFHHLALHAESRAEVDAFHAFLLRECIHVLDAPAEYDYAPGYYAVFFADPDGLKLELVHEP
jgi:catechol 2,3-dioxygenase-like lactoylglutathione lyase family enzyme